MTPIEKESQEILDKESAVYTFLRSEDKYKSVYKKFKKLFTEDELNEFTEAQLQFKVVKKTDVGKGRWTPEEVATLTQFVAKFDDKQEVLEDDNLKELLELLKPRGRRGVLDKLAKENGVVGEKMERKTKVWEQDEEKILKKLLKKKPKEDSVFGEYLAVMLDKLPRKNRKMLKDKLVESGFELPAKKPKKQKMDEDFLTKHWTALVTTLEETKSEKKVAKKHAKIVSALEMTDVEDVPHLLALYNKRTYELQEHEKMDREKEEKELEKEEKKKAKAEKRKKAKEEKDKAAAKLAQVPKKKQKTADTSDDSDSSSEEEKKKPKKSSKKKRKKKKASSSDDSSDEESTPPVSTKKKRKLSVVSSDSSVDIAPTPVAKKLKMESVSTGKSTFKKVK